MGFIFLFILLVLFFVTVIFLVAVTTFLIAGRERHEHPWKNWGLDDNKDDEES